MTPSSTRRYARALALGAAALTSGCVNILQQNQAAAVQTAQARARFELDCPQVETSVLSQKTVEGIRWELAEYTIGARGCGRQAVYLTYLEEVLDDWLRGVLGGAWHYVAAHVPIDYRDELRLDARHAFGTVRLDRVGTKSVSVRAELCAPEGRLAAEATMVVVARDPETGSSRALGLDRPEPDLIHQFSYRDHILCAPAGSEKGLMAVTQGQVHDLHRVLRLWPVCGKVQRGHLDLIAHCMRLLFLIRNNGYC